MVKLLRKNGSIEHILVEKTDRLTRNFRDVVKIDDLGRTIHFVKEGNILTPDSKSGEKLMHDIKVVLAKNYIDNLSEETSKGMLEKARQNIWPSVAPLGYLNNRETKRIDVDFKRAPIIRELFEEYSSGKMSLRSATKYAKEKGLRSKKGNTVSQSNIYKILINPIYIGDFVWKGVYYKGSHNPIVSREVFDRVQIAVRNKSKPAKRKHDLAFRGLARCGNCGCMITGEFKKEKYTYYRCTRMRGNCVEKPITESRLAEMLGEPLKRLRMTDERLEWIIEALKESHQEEKKYKAEEIRKLESEYEGLSWKIDKLYEDKLEDVIPPNFWKSKFKEYQSRQDKITELIEEHRTAGKDYLENGVRILELAQKAYSLYVMQDSFEKRKLLDLLYWNCTLEGGIAKGELRKPFDLIADGVAEEERLIKEKAPEKALNENWLLR